jgi:uncharacterized membrane protein
MSDSAPQLSPTPAPNEGKITRVVEQGQRVTDQQAVSFQTLEVQLTRGPLAGQTVTTSITTGDLTNPMMYHIGDQVIVVQNANAGATSDTAYLITDFVRREPLWILGMLFAVIVVIVGRWKGFWSLLALLLSFGILVKMTLPLMILGWNPILVSVLTAVVVLPINFYLAHGWSYKTHLSILSTILILVLTSCLGQFFIERTHLTGLSSDEAGFLLVEKPGVINMKSLILAGIIVGGLGILDDITVSQTSIVFEMKKANSKLSTLALYRHGMNIGQDHISSMVNTMVLVYASTALPLLLLFTDNPRPLNEILNAEIIAEEIVRTLVGSIGLILAAPIATALAAIVVGKNWVPEKELASGETHTHTHA